MDEVPGGGIPVELPGHPVFLQDVGKGFEAEARIGHAGRAVGRLQGGEHGGRIVATPRVHPRAIAAGKLEIVHGPVVGARIPATGLRSDFVQVVGEAGAVEVREHVIPKAVTLRISPIVGDLRLAHLGVCDVLTALESVALLVEAVVLSIVISSKKILWVVVDVAGQWIRRLAEVHDGPVAHGAGCRAVRPRVLPEVLVEAPILFHNENHVLECRGGLYPISRPGSG